MAAESTTQEEIWDDSALVKSWNEAYQEYHKYHSLAAKGEKVDLASLKTEKLLPNGNNAQPKPAKEAQIDRERRLSTENPTGAGAQQTAVPTAPSASAVGSIPQALIATVQSDDMKNLMMSWYYAGYYTGLYEGKQQGYEVARQGG